jgi:hypothetical protein
MFDLRPTVAECTRTCSRIQDGHASIVVGKHWIGTNHHLQRRRFCAGKARVLHRDRFSWWRGVRSINGGAQQAQCK